MTLERTAVARGALAAIAVTAPVQLLALMSLANDDTGDSLWPVVLAPLMLVGFGLGGGVAAGRSLALPYLHAVAAVIAAWLVVLAIQLVDAAVTGTSGSTGEVALNLLGQVLLFSSAGLVGALIATRSRIREDRP